MITQFTRKVKSWLSRQRRGYSTQDMFREFPIPFNEFYESFKPFRNTVILMLDYFKEHHPKSIGRDIFNWIKVELPYDLMMRHESSEQKPLTNDEKHSNNSRRRKVVRFFSWKKKEFFIQYLQRLRKSELETNDKHKSNFQKLFNAFKNFKESISNVSATNKSFKKMLRIWVYRRMAYDIFATKYSPPPLMEGRDPNREEDEPSIHIKNPLVQGCYSRGQTFVKCDDVTHKTTKSKQRHARMQSRLWHPDTNLHCTAEEKKKAAENLHDLKTSCDAPGQNDPKDEEAENGIGSDTGHTYLELSASAKSEFRENQTRIEDLFLLIRKDGGRDFSKYFTQIQKYSARQKDLLQSMETDNNKEDIQRIRNGINVTDQKFDKVFESHGNKAIENGIPRQTSTEYERLWDDAYDSIYEVDLQVQFQSKWSLLEKTLLHDSFIHNNVHDEGQQAMEKFIRMLGQWRHISLDKKFRDDVLQPLFDRFSQLIAIYKQIQDESERLKMKPDFKEFLKDFKETIITRLFRKDWNEF